MGEFFSAVNGGCRIKKRATLAQLVERLIRNQQVAGSIPAGGSMKSIAYQLSSLNLPQICVQNVFGACLNRFELLIQ